MGIYRWLMIVVVSQEGISLYRLWTLDWSSIRIVERRTKMGLDYLYFKTTKGRTHWVPLCFQGAGTHLLEVIGQVAPADNPVHEVLRSRRWDDRKRQKQVTDR